MRRAPTDQQWLAEQIGALTTQLEVLKPSEWAERRRYLPTQVTPSPGPYRFSKFPYLEEIVDCLSVESPVREVAFMKGVQVGATAGVIENAIGYIIDHVRTAPVMMVSAEQQLADSRLESYVLRMLEHSNLEHLIKSSDEKNPRKTGKTARKIEWVGGGWLTPAGANNPAVFRSLSYRFMLRDEIDGFPDDCGSNGDPLSLSEGRTAAFEVNRKIFDTSTPLIRGQSKIDRRFRLGDQRYYQVRCLSCGFPQSLRWRYEDPKTGIVSGITFEHEGGELVSGSVRWLCQNCQHEHFNDDKTRLFARENGAHWKPTARPSHEFFRSYHLSALYSPVGFQSWEEAVRKWCKAWDVQRNKPKDFGELQVFYNNIRGLPYELHGEKINVQTVSRHRRHQYRYGSISNSFATKHAAGPVLLLTTATDVHKDSLKTAVWGWGRGRRAFLVDYFTFAGATDNLENPETWGRLRELIDEKEYTADDGKIYRPGSSITLIDSGYSADVVYTFCNEYNGGVFPIKGQSASTKNATVREFSQFKTTFGTIGFNVTVDLYKDRWSAALRRGWGGEGLQPPGHFNAPLDATEAQLKELTVEVKRERRQAKTNKLIGWEWHRPPGSKNELWDLLIYGNAGLDMVAWDICKNRLEMESVNWPAFWDLLEAEQTYFT